jgi:hypothetical protein
MRDQMPEGLLRFNIFLPADMAIPPVNMRITVKAASFFSLFAV